MARITAQFLSDPRTQQVLTVLTDAGHQAFVVGGCVRNALMGRAISDVDIATDADPQTASRLAGKVGLKTVPTGIDHGTITVVAGGRGFEVTTFRRDIETDGRRAVVAFSDNILDDARRRDFTMNAVYADKDGVLSDPLGGIPDILARRVIFVGDARARIREDTLRILRFFRFHAWYGDPEQGLDPDGLDACAAYSAEIETLSNERVGAEMTKLLAAPDPGPAVASMAQAGILTQVLAGADASFLPVLVHLEAQVGADPDPMRRLALLGGQDPAERLRLSRADARRLAQLREEIGAADGPGALGYRHGYAAARDILLLRAAMQQSPLRPEDEAAARRGSEARFPLKAADLMPALKGPALGKKLSELEAEWIASDFTKTAEDLLKPD